MLLLSNFVLSGSGFPLPTTHLQESAVDLLPPGTCYHPRSFYQGYYYNGGYFNDDYEPGPDDALICTDEDGPRTCYVS